MSGWAAEGTLVVAGTAFAEAKATLNAKNVPTVTAAAGSGNCPSGWTSRLSRMAAWPGWRPVMKTHREGAQTVAPA